MYEFERMLEAWRQREDQRRRTEARWVANLMNATGNFKEAVTIDSLMPSQTDKNAELEKIRLRAEQRREERLRQRRERLHSERRNAR